MEEDVDEVVAEGGELVHQVVQPDKWYHQDDLLHHHDQNYGEDGLNYKIVEIRPKCSDSDRPI